MEPKSLEPSHQQNYRMLRRVFPRLRQIDVGETAKQMTEIKLVEMEVVERSFLLVSSDFDRRGNACSLAKSHDGSDKSLNKFYFVPMAEA